MSDEQQYLDMIKKVIDTGTVREGRGGAKTKSIFGYQSRYSLKDNKLPILTTKKVFTRGIIEELLWMLRGSTNVDELKNKNVHIWDGHSSREHLDNTGLSEYREGDIGPCFPANTSVLTSSGYVDIVDVSPSHQLMTHTGSYQKIIKKMSRLYYGELYKIKISYHAHEISCTPEHPFYVRELTIQGSTFNMSEPSFVPANELKKRHFVGMKINTNDLDTTFVINDQNIHYSDNDYIFFGYFLCKGMKEDNAYIIYDEDPQVKVNNIYAFGVRNSRSVIYSKYDTILETFFENGSLFPNRIPSWVYRLKKSSLELFLAGYSLSTSPSNEAFDTFFLKTQHKSVALSIQSLFLKIGRFCSLTFHNDEYYMDVISEENHAMCFIDNGYAWFPIESIKIRELDSPINVYNFSVDVDETYVVENAVVHNCYGFQWRHSGAEYNGCDENYTNQGVDQISNLINELRQNPYSRRHIVSSWSVPHIPKMALPPCHCLFQFYLDDNGLSCQLYQRSGDIGLGVPFNITFYCILTHLVAKLIGTTAYEFIHTLGDAHIYVEHENALLEQIQREPFDFPTLEITADVKELQDVEKMTASDFKIIGYKSHPKITMEMVV